MGDLNPFGIPPSVQRIMPRIIELIGEDHFIEDSHSVEGHVFCACGTLVPILQFVLHQSNEAGRIIEIEIDLTQ